MADVNSITVTDTEDTERESDINQVGEIIVYRSSMSCSNSQIINYINYNPSSSFHSDTKKNTKFSLQRQKCLTSPGDTNKKTFTRQEKTTMTSDSDTQN